ncbi:MAG: stage III sporulation protein AA [Clostridiales bacterium]|nr:stage III sporulation protein AA [Clostridiales bacterium]
MQPEMIYRLLPAQIGRMLAHCALDPEELQEIRLRTGRPVMVQYQGREYVLCSSGRLSEHAVEGYNIAEDEIKETLEYISGYSLYAFDEEIRQGFLTVSGGHRIGLAGHVVMEGNRIRCIRYISFLNIRLSHQRKGCADLVIPYLYEKGELCHTLILSPPGGGKTTLLRDLIRQVSNGGSFGAGRKVGVVDERSELAGAYLGVPQNDLGIRTDVLDGCTKAEGMRMLLRSMSPQVIAVDELGSNEDQEAVEEVFHCGCRLLATVHGASLEELKQKPQLKELLGEGMFERYVILSGRRKIGEVREIVNGQGEALYLCDHGETVCV